MPRKRIMGLSLDEETINEIDDRRGLVPRSAYVQNMLTTALNGGNDDEKTPSHRDT